MAATNKDLEQEIETGRFRSDLYHRLNQVSLRVPPLRERPEDIIAIADYFLAQQGENYRFSPAARNALLRYSWPGNVRELRNVVANGAILSRDCEIQASDLRLLSDRPSVREWNLDAMERKMIAQAIGVTGGHQQKAADLLGISQRTLSRKLRRTREPYAQAAYAEAV